MGLFKRLVLAANWWNPLIYIISAEHSDAREEISDNYALSVLKPDVYSGCLVDLAEKTCLISSLPATVGMAGRGSSLENRVKKILSKQREMKMGTGKFTKTLALSLVAVTSVALAGVQTLMAEEQSNAGINCLSMEEAQAITMQGGKLTAEQAGILEKNIGTDISIN